MGHAITTTARARLLAPLWGLAGLLFAAPLAAAFDYPEGSAIDWLGFDDAPFERAAEADRPLLIYFHAQWCTWCRRYQDESLEDPRVVELLGEHYVPLLVNLDRRRDLFSEYGGRGLPYTVIADGDGEVLFRFTGHVTPTDLAATLARRQEVSDGDTWTRPAEPETYPLVVADVLDWFEELYDPFAHRFHNAHERGDTGKRPQPLTWLWLLQQPDWQPRMAEVLALMAQDLVDPVAGGFYYFTDREVIAGEAEVETAKVLDLNARMAWAWAHAAVVLDESGFAETARATLDWMAATLLHEPSGALFGSQASDGDYFTLDATGRAERDAPPVERVVYTDFNAQAALAHAEVARLLEAPEYLAPARTLLTFIDRRLRDGDGHYHHWAPGARPEVAGFLPDQAWMAAAWWALHRAEIALGIEPAGTDGLPPVDALATVARLLNHIDAEYGGEAGYRERRNGEFTQPRSNSVLAWLGHRLLQAGIDADDLDGIDPANLTERALAGTSWRQGTDPDELALALFALE